MHGISTIISRIFRYREIASRTKFDGVLLPHREKKSAKSLTVVNRYTVGQDQNFNMDNKFAATELRIFAIRKIGFYSESPLF
jgi:hypothetical protein